MGHVKATILFDSIGWQEDGQTHFAQTHGDEAVETVELPEAEFKRLEALGAVMKHGKKAKDEEPAGLAAMTVPELDALGEAHEDYPLSANKAEKVAFLEAVEG